MVQKVDDPSNIHDNLSDLEREALEEAEAEEREALAAKDEDAVKDEAPKDEPKDAAPKDEPAKDAKPDDEPAKDDDLPADQAKADDDDEDTFVPDYRADPKRLEELTETLTANATKSEELRKQLSEGDISTDEYLAAKDKLDDERIDAKSELKALQRATEMSTAAQEQLWEQQQRRFFAEPENQIFREETDPVLFAALNSQVVLLANENPARSGAAILREAAAKVRARFEAPKADKPADAARQTAAQRRKAQADAQAGVQKTLGDMPNASESDGDLGEDPYADLDALLTSPDPMEQLEGERRLAAMSQSEQARYGTVNTRH